MATEDDSDIPETGAVFTFGKSKFADNLPNKFWVRNDRVRDVACGDEHTALVAESGRVFTFGSNDWGQLGLGHTKTADRPSCIKSLKSEKVKFVACGRVHTIVATESGKLYAFGANGENQLGVEDSPASNVPKCIDSLVTQQYKMLAAGADHSVALTDDGCVFVWGGGSEGQLGLGGKTECPEPEEIPIEDRVISISCGYYHTALVTDSGDLYTFGESEGGKLGLGDDPDDTNTPQKVSIPERVTAVACGGSHTIALTESGCIYTFGEGASGQLGHGTQCLQISTPRKVNINFKVSAVFCGENHSSIISEKGQMYTFGDGRHGKLALGQDSFCNLFIPNKVDRFQRFCVEKVSCGGCHMIALAQLRQENGDVYSSDDDIINEPKINGVLNHSLKADGSLDLNNSVTARVRRRKHNDSFKNELNRTLPALAGARLPSEHLHMTVPATTNSRKTEHKISPLAKEPNEEENEVQEDAIKPESHEARKSSPNLPPRPVPRKQPDPLKHEDEESEKEEEDSEHEEEEEEEEEEVKEDTQRMKPLAPIPKPRAQPKVPGMSEEEEEEEEEDDKSSGKKKKKKLVKKKAKSVTLFGKKKTAFSDDEEDEKEEEEEEEEVDEEETKETKVEETQAVKSATEGEEEEDDEDEEKDGKDKKKNKKDKKKDKKDKKDKTKDKKKDKKDKDKKKDKKKGKGDKEEEEEDEEDEEESGKNDKKDKKDKKKDKDKKDKKDKKKDKKDKKKGKDDVEEFEDEDEEEEDDGKKKDKKKDKKDKDKKDKDKKSKKDKDKKKNKDGDDKSDNEEDTDDKKTDDDKSKKEKPQEPPKKKSRTCTIL